MEENSEDYVTYNEEANSAISVVKSIFKNLIGSY